VPAAGRVCRGARAVIAGVAEARGRSEMSASDATLGWVACEEHHESVGDHEEVLSMCHEWWVRRRADETEQNRWLWDEFERTRPLAEPDVTKEPEVTLEDRTERATAADR